LACLLAVALAFLLFQKASPFVLALIALALSLLRVDLTILVAFAVVLMLSQGDRVCAAALPIGSGLSLLLTQLTMGHLLPDTALAKQGLRFFDVLGIIAYELAATFSCGIGLLLVWVVSSVVAWRVNRRSALIANMLFPVLALIAAARGQQIHGIRYMVWALLFSIVWNILIAAATSQPRPAMLIAFACLLAACWIYELPIVLRIDRGRAADLVTMQNANLNRLHGEGLAADVGYIGYFSAAPICDMNGLVNGREAALMTYQQRSQACMAARPAFLFVSELQMGYLATISDFNRKADWFDCGTVDVTNVRKSARFWLLVRRSQYPNGCPSHL